jgi:hypothetical protein
MKYSFSTQISAACCCTICIIFVRRIILLGQMIGKIVNYTDFWPGSIAHKKYIGERNARLGFSSINKRPRKDTRDLCRFFYMFRFISVIFAVSSSLQSAEIAKAER